MLESTATQPSVSIITPTYNRRRFIPWLIECIKAQTYRKECIEWVIYDDGSDKIRDILEPHMVSMNIRYFESDMKLNIGAKRNFLHDAANGKILVTMDDDDYYMPDRVSHAVQTLLSKKVDICGSSKNHLYFSDDGGIWAVGPYTKNHATFGTMAYTKAFTRTHRCDESVTFAEEVGFTQHYTAPLYQLNPMKVMLVLCHSENTFNKNKLRESPSPIFRKTDFKLKMFIRNAAHREFYSKA